ncbi:PTS sugar transporter subunit IIA [Aliivibrio sifiae]|uniref:PTS fructose transporter subunit IIA n=1 Tax=Aliivibrio sifiae TaxID=566293 RepID=A0A2S7X2E8_9GAMM|nr:PTS sugar transporter subunit IIA [Aliivibrio sifiae]PQJ84400.1 PTS fructose transporter subunit IIA [Aliivibrio sifiae]
MIEPVTNDYRITFFVKHSGLPPKLASQLARLAKKFKCLVYIENITRDRRSDVSSSLGLLQLALTEGDFCQLVTVGIDAEWANFVLTDLLSSGFDFIASDKSCDFSEAIVDKHPKLTPKCDINFHYVKAQTQLSKFEILKGLSLLICPEETDELLLLFIKREERSSTSMARRIALPHVITSLVDRPIIAIIRSDYSIDWASKMGDVNLVIALVLPENPTRDMIISATKLTRSMLSSDFSQRLVNTRQPMGLQALLLHAMCQE